RSARGVTCAGADRPGRARRFAEPGAAAAAHASLGLAALRPVQQRLARGVSRAVSVRSLAVHRADVPVPEGAARLALDPVDLERRLLVVRQVRDGPRLVAHPLPLTRKAA